MRKITAIAALVVAIAFPVTAFAASSTGSTPETLTVASTISMTVPGAQTYTLDDPDYKTPPAFITIVGSNNPSGVTITATVDVYDGPGAIEVGTNQRAAATSTSAAGSGAVLTPAFAFAPAGTFATSSTVVTIASSTGPLAGRQVGIEYMVAASNFSVAGSYTSAAHYTATTNP